MTTTKGEDRTRTTRGADDVDEANSIEVARRLSECDATTRIAVSAQTKRDCERAREAVGALHMRSLPDCVCGSMKLQQQQQQIVINRHRERGRSLNYSHTCIGTYYGHTCSLSYRHTCSLNHRHTCTCTRTLSPSTHAYAGSLSYSGTLA